jgi:hypothetical protein
MAMTDAERQLVLQRLDVADQMLSDIIARTPDLPAAAQEQLTIAQIELRRAASAVAGIPVCSSV